MDEKWVEEYIAVCLTADLLNNPEFKQMPT